MGFGVPVAEVDRGIFARFQASIDPAWVVEALSATGTATLRRRRFPAEQVIWLVLGMALFRDLRYVDMIVWSPVTPAVRAEAIRQVRAALARGCGAVQENG